MEPEGLGIVLGGRNNSIFFGYRQVVISDGNVVRFNGRPISIIRHDNGIMNDQIPHCLVIQPGSEPDDGIKNRGIENRGRVIKCAISEPGALALGFLAENLPKFQEHGFNLLVQFMNVDVDAMYSSLVEYSQAQENIEIQILATLCQQHECVMIDEILVDLMRLVRAKSGIGNRIVSLSAIGGTEGSAMDLRYYSGAVGFPAPAPNYKFTTDTIGVGAASYCCLKMKNRGNFLAQDVPGGTVDLVRITLVDHTYCICCAATREPLVGPAYNLNGTFSKRGYVYYHHHRNIRWDVHNLMRERYGPDYDVNLTSDEDYGPEYGPDDKDVDFEKARREIEEEVLKREMSRVNLSSIIEHRNVCAECQAHFCNKHKSCRDDSPPCPFCVQQNHPG